MKSKKLSLQRQVLALRYLLLAVPAALAALSVGVLAFALVQAWHMREAAVQVRAADAAGTQLITAIHDQVLERVNTNAALAAETVATPATRQRIVAHRAGAESGFAAALPTLAALAFPDHEALMAELRARLEAVQGLRQRADLALDLPRSGRDPELLKGWMPGMTALVNASVKAWGAALNTAGRADPDIARYAMLKQLGWVMREQSGFERAAVATAIASRQPFAPEVLARMVGFRAQVAGAWRVAQGLLDDDPDIARAVADMRNQHFETFEPLADHMRDLIQQRAALPMTESEWIDVTTPQIDSLLTLVKAAGIASSHVAQRLEEAAADRMMLAAAGLLATLAFATLCMLLVLRRVVGPLRRLTETTERLAAGETDIIVADRGRGDEMGALASAIEVFRLAAIENRRLSAEQETLRAAGEAEKRSSLMAMAATVEGETSEQVDRLSSQTTRIADIADRMAGSAVRTGTHSKEAAEAAGRSLESAAAVASAAEQLSASIREIAGQVARSTAIVGEAVQIGGRAGTSIAALTEQVGRIDAIATAIADIAGRTNLLALNATIEAARAGEAGRGFAVVAGEVKALANQTARATEEIARQIVAVRGATGIAVQAVGDLGTAIDQVNHVSAAIAAAVEEQNAATNEIAGRVTDAAEAARVVNRRIAEVSADAERTGREAGEVHAESDALAGNVGELRRAVIRIVRGSTEYVDRRQSARFQVDMPCRVRDAAGVIHTARLRQLSTGGGQLTGMLALSVGQRGTLLMSDPVLALPFEALGQSGQDDTQRVAFRLDAATEAAFARVPERLGTRMGQAA
jgi:methyl-accepting chemotaxis protein